MNLNLLTITQLKKIVSSLSLGSWVNVQMISEDNVSQKDVEIYLSKSANLIKNSKEGEAVKIKLESAELYFYDIGDFLFDFDPGDGEHLDRFIEILVFFKRLSKQLGVIFRFFDETDHSVPLLEINGETVIETKQT